MKRNLADDLFRAAERWPDRRALVREDGDALSYTELANRVRGVSSGLRHEGIEVGDRVLYQLSNGPAVTVLFYATLAAGAVAVPVSPLLTPRETDEIRSRVDARFSIGETPGDAHDLTLEGPEEIDALPRSAAGESYCERTESDPAVIFFTSGTTGRPKGVVLSHRNLSSNAQWVGEHSLDDSDWDSDACSAAVLPLSHSFGLTCSQNAAIRAGASISYLARFDADRLLDCIRRDQVTVAALVPSAAGALLEAWRRRPGPVPLKYGLIGGAPIPDALVEDLEGSLKMTVLEGYGLTETSPVCAFRTPGTPRKQGSVGRAAGFANLAVLEAGGQVRKEGEGELLVRGPGVFEGYLDPIDGEEESPFLDGWFRTGDVARLDGNGDVFILDRKKDLIIRNGYNVSPVEIERVLIGCPGVLDAGVVGLPDPDVGEEIAAYVVTSSSEPPRDEIREACRRGLAKYKWPSRIERIEEIPRGAKGQVLRDRLRVES